MEKKIEKQVIQYATLEFMQLYSLAKGGDEQAEKELLAREAAQKAEIESLKIKANSKRAPKAEKTPKEIAQDNAYYRTALLVKQFGLEFVDMQTLTMASAYLECGLAQGNLRQAFNRVQQILKAQSVEETVFPDWLPTAAKETPVLDENKKLEEESDKIEQIKAIVARYTDSEAPAPAAPAPAAPAPAAPAATSKKGGKK